MIAHEVLNDEYHESKIDRYIMLEKLGEGTFGEVRKAKDRLNGDIVAVKFVRNLSKKSGITKSLFREMQALKSLTDSIYVIKLYDVFVNDSNLCLVMEYVSTDLNEIINTLNGKDFLSRSQIKTVFKMIFEAIAYCHVNNIIHRDIKPANLLVTSQGIIKLADFGLARIYCGPDSITNDINESGYMSHQVATRYYRAPELLYASRTYDFMVDIWAAGVVMAELLTLKTIFPGNNDIDQMYKVFQIMGTPNPGNWEGVELLPDYSKVTFPHMEPLDLSMIMPNAHIKDIEFVALSLKLNPKDRINARDALTNKYFQENPTPCSTFFFPFQEKCNISKQKQKNDITFVDIVNNLFI